MPRSSWFRRVFLAWLLALLSVSPVHPQTTQNAPRLDPRQPVERRLAQKEIHRYTISTQAGQFLSIRIEQMRLDMSARLFGPDDTKVFEIDNAERDDESLALSLLSTGGEYRLELQLRTKNAIAGDYRLTVSEPRSARAEDEKRIAAERLGAAGNRLRAEDSAESMAQAVVQFEQALPIWRELGDQREEARALLALSDVRGGQADNQKRIDLAGQALELFRAAGDHSGEAAAHSTR